MALLSEKTLASRWYPYYCLAILCFLNFLDQADRWAIPTLQSAGLQCASCGSPERPFYEKCKAMCLSLTDFEMGILTGPSFSFTTLALSFPSGYLADRYHRVRLLWGGLLAWSTATIVTAFASEFWQILLLRIALGVGQSVVAPCAFSIISDLFLENRSLYLSFFISMIFFGQVFGISSAAISYATNWRVSFLCLGVPGLLLSVPFILTVQEPERGLSDRRAREGAQEKEEDGERIDDVTLEDLAQVDDADDADVILEDSVTSMTLRKRGTPKRSGNNGKEKEKEKENEEEKDSDLADAEFGAEGLPGDATRTLVGTDKDAIDGVNLASPFLDALHIFSFPPFLSLWVSVLFRAMASYALGGWVQVFYKRVHGIQITGDYVAVLMLFPLFGASSSYLGSWAGDKLTTRFVYGKMLVCCFCCVSGALLYTSALLQPSSFLSLLSLLFGILFSEMWYPLSVSTCLDMHPPAKRSFASAMYLTAVSLASVATVVVGWMNEWIGKEVGTTETDYVRRQGEDTPYDPTPALLIVVPGFCLTAFVFYSTTAYFLEKYQNIIKKRVAEGKLEISE